MATPFKSIGPRTGSWFTARQQRPMRKQDKRCRPRLEGLEERTLLSFSAPIGDVFYIDMENHNLTQPSGLVGEPQQLLGNPAAPYLNSLITPGNPNAAQTSYASDYYNVLYNNPAVSIHPSEPNYVWQEGGSNFGVLGDDDDPYANNGNPAPLNNNVNLIAATGNNPDNLSALLQAAGIPWKSYQEDIDLIPTSGSVNQPDPNSLTSTVAPQSQWTVPLSSFSGTSPAYTNPYNGSDQYNFAPKHDGQLFYTATNGGDNTTPSNPEAQFYAPLQQLQTDLNNNTVARYNLITPDQYNDMHSSLNTNFTYNGVTYAAGTDQEAVALGDNFLSKIIPEIMASQAYKNNGAIVIWYDETEGGNTTQFTLPEIVISPQAKGNAYDSTLPYTHSSDLKTMEELFGVYGPGGEFLGDANTPDTNDLSDLFLPLPGATVQGNTLYLVGGNTNDQLNITPIGASQTGSTGINVNGQLNGVNINNQTFTGVTSIYAVGFGGNNNFQFAGSLTIPSVVRAGDGNDQIQLDNGNNTVNLGDGNDTVNLGDGNDTVNLGDGNDQVTQGGGSTQGGNGNNTVTAGDGNDQVQLGDGNNTVTLGAGNNTVTAGDGNDQVQLGDGNNTVTLGAGNNTVTAGDGNDQVQLGDGNNTVTLGAGNNTVTAGDGNDQVQLGDGTNTVTLGAGNDQVQAGNGNNDVSITGNGNDQVTLGNGNNDNVQLVGNGNDQIQVGNGNNDNASIAGNGNDQVKVGNGNNGYVSIMGNGNENVQTGTGTGQLKIRGTGQQTLNLGSGWTQI